MGNKIIEYVKQNSIKTIDFVSYKIKQHGKSVLFFQ